MRLARLYVEEIKSNPARAREPLNAEHLVLKAEHRRERQKLKEGQSKRWHEETKARSAKPNKGLRGLFDRLTGAAKLTRSKNEREAYRCAKRDQVQRDQLMIARMKERKKLQKRMQKFREGQKRTATSRCVMSSPACAGSAIRTSCRGIASAGAYAGFQGDSGCLHSLT